MVAVLRILLYAGFGIVFLALAGRLDLPFPWIFFAVFLIFGLCYSWLAHPDLKKLRLRRAKGGNPTLRLCLMLLAFVMFCIAALDVGRLHFSDNVPLAAQIVGVIGLSVSLFLFAWATTVNRFFVPTIQIQKDRGHQVIRTGPYRYLRHPGYAGMIGVYLFGGMLLGSWLAIMPAVVAVPLIVRRLVLEERVLRQELDGYLDYLVTVRSRILPGIW